jgi:hypothetical protein
MVNAVAQTRNNLIAAKGKIILLIDLHSSQADLDSIFKKAAVPTTTKNALLAGDYSALIKDGWVMVKKQNNVVQFNRSLRDMKGNPQENPYIITASIVKTNSRPGYLDVVYGANNFAVTSVYELPSGLTRFFLPGHLTSRRVFLSGSFNDWSTLKGLMAKTDEGWIIDLKLKPGAYEYKFIADSRWMDDPNNVSQINDGQGNTNSVYYRCNYTFRLKGFSSAHTVALAGSFNKWNTNELLLEKNGDTWEIPIYLNEGTHEYRFKVDGKWMTDPTNPDKHVDEDGNISSVLNIGETVNFKLTGYGNAKNVSVAGDFTQWKPNKINLKRIGDTWVASVKLSAGNYSYKFVVDGDWVLDPSNKNYTVIDKQINCFLAVSPTHTFKLKGYDNAKVIHLSGSFNDWNQNSYMLAHNGNEWSISMYLKPGKYLYKFIVDDNWIIDPGNKQWEQNQYGTGNSVLWIEP